MMNTIAPAALDKIDVVIAKFSLVSDFFTRISDSDTFKKNTWDGLYFVVEDCIESLKSLTKEGE